LESPEANSELPSQYETAIRLLKLIQVDYGRARRQLEDVSSLFGHREAAAAEQLRSALDNVVQIGSRYDIKVSVRPSQVLKDQALSQEGVVSHLAAHQSLPSLEVCCLGKFEIRADWKKIEDWHSNKARLLLKYLIAQQGRPVSKDIVMEALWPGCEPSLASNNLKTAARALRQTLSSADDTGRRFAWVLCQDGNYRINPEVDLWVDVGQFEYHWHAGRQLERKGKLAEAVKEYEAAEVLYKGDYLEDDLYEDWTSLRREELKDTYLAVLGRLADYSIQNADYDGCIVYCQKILNKDSCREDAYRRLMCCCSRLGQRSRALGWYRVCEKTVKAQLDVYPEGQTMALYQKLLEGEYI